MVKSLNNKRPSRGKVALGRNTPLVDGSTDGYFNYSSLLDNMQYSLVNICKVLAMILDKNLVGVLR